MALPRPRRRDRHRVIPGHARTARAVGVRAGGSRHSIEYHRPEPFAGARVLVVGAGNSGGEIAAELAAVAAPVSIAIRSGRGRRPAGDRRYPEPVPRAAHAPPAACHRGADRRPRPRDAGHRASRRPCRARPRAHSTRSRSSGCTCPTRSRPARSWSARRSSGSPGSRSLRRRVGGGVREVIMATGFRAALDPLGGLVTRDARGFARRTRPGDQRRPARPVLRRAGVRRVGRPANIRHDAPLAADASWSALASSPGGHGLLPGVSGFPPGISNLSR